MASDYEFGIRLLSYGRLVSKEGFIRRPGGSTNSITSLIIFQFLPELTPLEKLLRNKNLLAIEGGRKDATTVIFFCGRAAKSRNCYYVTQYYLGCLFGGRYLLENKGKHFKMPDTVEHFVKVTQYCDKSSI